MTRRLNEAPHTESSGEREEARAIVVMVELPRLQEALTSDTALIDPRVTLPRELKTLERADP